MTARCSTPETICVQCGNRGFTNAFVYCVKCINVAVHRYCLNVIPSTVDEFVRWICEDCASEVQNQSVGQCKTKDHSTYSHSQVLERNLDGNFERYNMLCEDNNIQNVEQAQEMSSSSGRGRDHFQRLRALFSTRGSSSRDEPESSTCVSNSVGIRASIHGSSLDADFGAESATPGVALFGPRTRVTLERDGSLAPAQKVPTSITNSFKKYIDIDGYAWRFVSERTKRIYFDEFMKLFYWDAEIDQQVRKQWALKAAVRYKDFVCKAKVGRHTKGRPEYIPKLAWERWCAYWDTDAAQSISRQAKKNRLHEPGGPGTGVITHRGGSRSASAYAAAFAAERGVEVNDTLLDIFYKMHRVDGHYTDSKSARIGAEIDRITAERSQPLPDGTQAPPLDMNAIYLEVAARSDKGRVFGLGSMYCGRQAPAASSFRESSAFYPSQYSQVVIDALARSDARANELARRLEAVEAQNARQRRMLEQIYRCPGEDGSSSPPLL